MTEAMYIDNSPIAYFIDDNADGDWVVFIHAAFVDHRMFNSQFEYFSGKYKLLAKIFWVTVRLYTAQI